METMNTILERYKKADADYKALREKGRQQTSSLASAKQAVRRLEKELPKKMEGIADVVGTDEEDAVLSEIESLKAELLKAKSRSDLLERATDRRTTGLDKVRAARRNHYQRLLYLVVQAELARFPEEAREVLSRALSVANMMTGWSWEGMLSDALRLPNPSQETARLGQSVIAEHIPGLASGGLG